MAHLCTVQLEKHYELCFIFQYYLNFQKVFAETKYKIPIILYP